MHTFQTLGSFDTHHIHIERYCNMQDLGCTLLVVEVLLETLLVLVANEDILVLL